MVEVGTSARSGANSGRERAAFPRLADDIGHDPARWLDWSLIDDADRRRLVRSVIAGLMDAQTVRAWIAVERRLGRGPDDGPREPVIAWLEERLAEHEAVGRTDLRAWLDRQAWGEPPSTPSQVRLLREQDDGSVEAVDPSVRDKTSRRRASLAPEGSR